MVADGRKWGPVSAVRLLHSVLNLLKPANACPGSETDDTIDLPPVAPFAVRSLLHLLDVIPRPDSWYFSAKSGSRSKGR
jgi:hypothetical protein